MANTTEKITYKGEKWPVRISYYAIKQFTKDTGVDIRDIDKDVAYLEVLLWYGLVAGCNAESKELTIKREEMEFMLDESMGEFNNAIIAFFPTGVTPDGTAKKK